MSLCQIYSLACELGTVPGPDISLFQSSVMHVYYYFYNIKISFRYFKRKTKNKTIHTTKNQSLQLRGKSENEEENKEPLFIYILRNLVNTLVDLSRLFSI